ncbi:MAG: Fic family protein [Firmicutes bacterium]|nr:Fic family protein [Bacillota bacterium]
MKDVYMYDDAEVLKNRLGIKNEEELNKAEGDITCIRLLDIDKEISGGLFDYARLKAIHKYIFGDIYEWAGKERVVPIVKGERVLGGDTVRYSIPGCIENDANKAIDDLNSVKWQELSIDETASIFSVLLAALWQVHPFREGNTRTIITFATQFAEYNGFKMNKALLRDNAEYVRDSLVKASDGPYSDYQYLRRIIHDSIEKG